MIDSISVFDLMLLSPFEALLSAQVQQIFPVDKPGFADGEMGEFFRSFFYLCSFLHEVIGGSAVICRFAWMWADFLSTAVIRIECTAKLPPCFTTGSASMSRERT